MILFFSRCGLVAHAIASVLLPDGGCTLTATLVGVQNNKLTDRRSYLHRYDAACIGLSTFCCPFPLGLLLFGETRRPFGLRHIDVAVSSCFDLVRRFLNPLTGLARQP